MGKILIIAHRHSQRYGLFDDLQSEERAILRYSFWQPVSNRLLQFLRRIHLSWKINSIIKLPYRYLWYDFHDVPSLLSEIQHIVIIDLALEDPVTLELLKKCRSIKPKLRVSLYFLNAIGSNGSQKRDDLIKTIEHANKFEFDEKYTFDIADAQTYGMQYLGFNYYSKHNIKNISNPQHDIYYIGRSSLDRNDLFYTVYNKLASEDCNFDFYIKPIDAEERRLPGVIYIDKGIKPYNVILEDLQNSKCILEILREKQTGPSLRYFEAVCYNKKLLTTNPEIVNFPYYDSRFMKYFSNPKDIDVEWLKDDSVKVDYHYNGEFSPITLINQLIEESNKNCS